MLDNNEPAQIEHASLKRQHKELDARIDSANTGVIPMASSALKVLKIKRLHLKERIAMAEQQSCAR